MKKLTLALLAAAAALAITPAAMADTFYFQFSANGVISTGTLVGTENGNTGMYTITSGSITTTSGYGTYSGTIDTNPGDMSANDADNLLFFPPNNGQYLDGLGLIFAMGPGEEGGINEIWSGDNYGNGSDYSNWFWDDADIKGGGSFTVSLTPEPSSLLLLGTGFLGLALLAFRKRSSGRTQLSLQS